jgi:hypothetical protein
MVPVSLMTAAILVMVMSPGNGKIEIAVAVQSFGGFQNFHPHLHVLATDGLFYNDAAFMVCPAPMIA